MAAEMKVTDAALHVAIQAAYDWDSCAEFEVEAMRAALEAGLAAMLEPVGYASNADLDYQASQREMGRDTWLEVWVKERYPFEVQLFRIKDTP